MHRKYPAEWEKVEKNWVDIYPDLPFSINVVVKIREPGMITTPVEVK